MSRLVLVAAAAVVAMAAFAASARADQQVWVIDNWPADIGRIPCSAWSRNVDGTWILTGGAIKIGAQTMDNIMVRGDAAAHALDRECGAKK